MRLREIGAALRWTRRKRKPSPRHRRLGLALKAARHKAKKAGTTKTSTNATAAAKKEQQDGHAAPSDECLLVELMMLPASGLVGRTPRTWICRWT